MNYKTFDLRSWNRREIFEHFANMRQPHYDLTSVIDVTPLVEYKREHGLSFYLSLIYLATKSLNTIENFRLRMKGQEVVIYDRIETNFTHKRPEEDIFYFHTAPLEGTLQEYVAATSKAIAAQTTLFGGLGDIPNVAYFSCVPTIEITAVTNPGMENPCDAIPRINWGKYIYRDGRYTLGISLTVNHRFIDGYHIALFLHTLQEEICQLQKR